MCTKFVKINVLKITLKKNNTINNITRVIDKLHMCVLYTSINLSIWRPFYLTFLLPICLHTAIELKDSPFRGSGTSRRREKMSSLAAKMAYHIPGNHFFKALRHLHHKQTTAKANNKTVDTTLQAAPWVHFLLNDKLIYYSPRLIYDTNTRTQCTAKYLTDFKPRLFCLSPGKQILNFMSSN